MKQQKQSIQTNNIFAYGSLMFPEVIYGVIKGKYNSENGTIHNFSRRQVKGKVYPGLIKQQSSILEGVIYHNLSQQDIKTLHYFEGDEYTPIQVNVETSKGSAKAIAYLHSNPSNLQEFEWDLQDFKNNHRSQFAADHINSKGNQS